MSVRSGRRRRERPEGGEGEEIRLLATFKLQRTGGLAASPGSCPRIAGLGRILRKRGVCHMRVVLSTWGSRGDVEPLAGLAVRLREPGARVRVCAPPDEEFVALPDGAGVPLVPLGPAVRSVAAGLLLDTVSR
ncbi:hypothetical protein GCM10027168_13180 [Streptomyces capparidis]